jgi:hypothetical protein
MHIIVSDEWLSSCGMQRYCGVKLKVIKHTPMWSPGESMYEVELPEGRPWVVWSIRGVTEVDEPEPVTIEPTPVPEQLIKQGLAKPATDYLSVQSKRKIKRKRHGTETAQS